MMLQTDPRPVAVARTGIGIAAVLNSLEAWEILNRIVRLDVKVPWEAFAVDVTEVRVMVVVGASILAGIAVAVGWHVEIAAIASTALGVFVLAWDQQMYSSHRWLATLLMACLIFARAGSAWSVDSRARRTVVPWWPQLLLMTQLSVCYLFAGLSKLNPVFLSGVPLESWVWIELPQRMFVIASANTILVEIFIAVGLWFSSSRRIAVALGLALHGSILILMVDERPALIAFTITCVCLYPLFLTRPDIWPWERGARRDDSAPMPHVRESLLPDDGASDR
ncbi:HTTM domain-containing protein [Agromyces sp. M3QZ16-3]|uniref:HTTM domain-containing protein n=1 Tax=Agromyces sp. M3QZ16-3 TaxID=3447585 RepID=UPI003F691F4B